MSALAELLERVKAATGPDLELDRLLAEATGWEHRSGKPWDRVLPWERPAVTASLDAALALVERVLPEGFAGFQKNRHVGDERRWSAYLTVDQDEHEATTWSPALALILALLRAINDQPDVGSADLKRTP